MSARRYGQYCGLARALDLIGDRWTLLIVRELLIGPARYQQLRDGLPGIATNLLADRLRQLERDGLVQRQIAGDATAVAYALTTFGAELRDPIEALLRWSEPLMASGPRTDQFRPHWLRLSLPALLSRPHSGRRRAEAPAAPNEASVAVTVASTTLSVRNRDGCVTVSPSDHGPFDASIRADPEIVLGLAAGILSVAQAIDAADRFEGDPEALATVFVPFNKR